MAAEEDELATTSAAVSPRAWCSHNVGMAKTHEVQGIDHLPVYLISSEEPWEVAEGDFIDGVPLVDVLRRMRPDDHLYFVDFSSVLGRTKLTRLV